MIQFKPLLENELAKLREALAKNRSNGGAILTDSRDTSFVGASDDLVTDDEVVSAIKSVPCHYSICSARWEPEFTPTPDGWYPREAPTPPGGRVWATDGRDVWMIWGDGKPFGKEAVRVLWWKPCEVPEPPKIGYDRTLAKLAAAEKSFQAGIVYDVRVFDRVLSAEEILAEELPLSEESEGDRMMKFFKGG